MSPSPLSSILSSDGRRVVENQQVNSVGRNLLQQVSARERNQRSLQLRGAQRLELVRPLSTDDLNETGRRQEASCPSWNAVVRHLVQAAEGSTERTRRVELIRDEGRDRGVERGGRVDGKEVCKQTRNVGRRHRGAGDGVNGVLGTDPAREDVESWSENVNARTEVAEVCALVAQRGRADSDCLLGGGRRVGACIAVIIASGNSEVKASVDGTVDSSVKSA